MTISRRSMRRGAQRGGRGCISRTCLERRSWICAWKAGYTDPPISTSNGGQFMYWETIQKQGYTNNGQIFGAWVGREGKGGQAWLTYHLSGNEWIQASYRNQKVAKDFIPGGTTLNEGSVQVVKRLGSDLELNGTFDYETWKAPVYNLGVPEYPTPSHGVTLQRSS